MNELRRHDRGVVVIGAGAAGLAATLKLRAHGVPTTLIDALPRIGGRAVTAQVGADPFDLGATWLHDADRNPLVPLAGPGDRLLDSDAQRHERLTIGGRLATAAEQAAYDAAWDQFDDAVAPALAGPDVTLDAAMAPIRDRPWTGLLALWEGAIIAGADADVLGLRDWHRNRLEGRNRVPAAGVGAFIARVLATEATLSCPATKVTWSGGGVVVETPRGTLRAAAAIVTVSTGVLAAGHIRFDPPLPAEVQDAIHTLPMGLLSKIALPATGPDRLGLAPSTLLVDREAVMTFNAWPQGRGYIAGFIGGRSAWSVAPDPAAAEDLARSELRRTLGADALAAIGPAAITSSWGTDPAFLGGYAYAGPGDAEQRGVLAGAFPAERLLFAGEATRTDGLAGTVGGAYLSGIEAADRLLATAAADRRTM